MCFLELYVENLGFRSFLGVLHQTISKYDARSIFSINFILQGSPSIDIIRL